VRHTWTVDELSGINKAPTRGTTVYAPEGNFVARGVVVGISMLYNMSTGQYGLVTAVTPTTLQATHGGWYIDFSPGDFWRVLLAAPWVVQNEDGPLIEIECNICGFSYPRKGLVKGRCSRCIDTSQRAMR